MGCRTAPRSVWLGCSSWRSFSVLSLGVSARADERLTIGDRLAGDPARDEVVPAARAVLSGNLARVAVPTFN